MFLAELLGYATRAEQQGDALFHFLMDSILWLDQAASNFSNFHIVFMIKLTAYLGFSPNIESGAGMDYFDLVDGCFVSAVPTHRNYLDAEDSMRMVHLLRLD